MAKAMQSYIKTGNPEVVVGSKRGEIDRGLCPPPGFTLKLMCWHCSAQRAANRHCDASRARGNCQADEYAQREGEGAPRTDPRPPRRSRAHAWSGSNERQLGFKRTVGSLARTPKVPYL